MHYPTRMCKIDGGIRPRSVGSMNRLEGKAIIVTGSTTGIGEAIARRCVAEGARVLIHGREREAGELVAASLHGQAVFHHDDLADAAAALSIIAGSASYRWSPLLDVTLNNP